MQYQGSMHEQIAKMTNSTVASLTGRDLAGACVTRDYVADDTSF